jgi:tRNA nucleotidyltransferase (CCA-adding enzyme)
MHISLTHEQADFDAIASLLGSFLIGKNTLPILPRRINRNVRAFLTIYGSELPFIEQPELIAEHISKITLVDTQSMVSIKGVDHKTKVHLVDHHPLREDIPKDWSITVAATGANTTIFIEALRDLSLTLDTIQATLLLLGIYEDTGSLTYIRTTPRDLSAASYLLAQGADLTVAANFLNHPLSQIQQAIFARLINNIEYFNVLGHRILITTTDATDTDEELSTIAHKIRDQYDPDALFVLVKTKGGVQFIARSMSDDIDVAQIAILFRGGGHDRAAAALVKDGNLLEIKQQLIELLPKVIRPAITVSQIMSKNPKLISPDTSVEDAAKKMQRYGYEGFPVVRENEVIGLLTRRAVDRARSHKLSLKVASLMEAGNFSVRIDDSVDFVQKVMIDSGWGQLPVIDPSTKAVVGIVTRTDLIKTIKSHTAMVYRQNYADKLEKFLPIERLVLLRAIADAASAQSSALYIVGGFVRDLILDLPSHDFDLVVEGDAIQLAKELSRQYSGRITSHKRFSTAKWVVRDHKIKLQNKLSEEYQHLLSGATIALNMLPDSIDLVSARTEFYTYPSALPIVERGSIKLDLHRRDFTINTLALRLDGIHHGELYDYWGGLNDIKQGLIRVLHSLSFVDDPTRILRAIRFEQRFDFKIDKRTQELMTEALPLLSKVSGDRLRHEIEYIFVEKSIVKILSRLYELELMKTIHPELKWDAWLEGKFEFFLNSEPEKVWSFSEFDQVNLHKQISYILLLLRLSDTATEHIATHLKLSLQLLNMIRQTNTIFAEIDTIMRQKPSVIAERLNGIPIVALYAIFIAVDQQNQRDLLLQYVTTWKNIKSAIDGSELKAIGIPPGPLYRQILKEIRGAMIDGNVKTEAEQRNLMEVLLAELKKP